MIKGLEYLPKPGELLYHYCSPATLLAVAQYRTLRLSSVTSMNDSLELQWGVRLLADYAEKKWADETKHVFSELLEAFSSRFGFLASCFSTEGDMLSQWRAYADDGRGFCIGFDPAAVASIPSRLLRVCYEKSAQEKILSDALSEVLMEDGVEVSDEEGDKRTDQLVMLLLDVIGFKNPAFKEEQEVRLVRLMYHQGEEFPLLLPGSGEIDLHGVKFQMRGSKPSPYLDVQLPGDNAGIKEIVIGPRADVTDRELQLMMGALGFKGIVLRRSEASYR